MPPARLVPVAMLPIPVNPSLTTADNPAARLVSAWLSGRSPRTLAAYRADLAAFAMFCGLSPDESAARIIALPHGDANGLALAWRANMLESGLAPATVNRRLAALRSLVSLANTLGLVAWELSVPGVKSQAYRDTRGPGKAGVKKMLTALPDTPKGIRDRAIIRLLYDLALRRAEVCGIDLSDLGPELGSVAILGKGKTEKISLTLPGPTADAIRAWLAVRPAGGDALFVSLSNGSRGHRLTGDGICYVVEMLGKVTGQRVRPHGLRHAGVTQALNLAKGDVRKVQRFSRHRDLRTLTIYDDNRHDFGGEIARMVAEDAAV